MENKDNIVDAELVTVESNEASNLPAVRTVANSAGTEIVTYGANGEILDCKFTRVDFDTPATILSYCDDIKDEISAILDSTAQMALDSQEVQIDDDMLSNITSFEDSLDESDKKAEKEKNLPAVIKGIRGILTTLGVRKIDEKIAEETTYKGRYEKYCEGLDEVSAAVESQKQGAMNDIGLRNAIIAEIAPYIEILEEMIKVGEIDRATYDESIEALRQLPQDQDTQYMIQYKTQLSEVFNGKLNRLSKALVALKGQVQEYRLQNGTDMNIVMEADSYLKDTAPLLKSKGSVKVFNHQQANRTVGLAKLNEASNQAFIDTAKELEENALASVELSNYGGITLEALEAMVGAGQRGIAIFKNARQQKQQIIAQERQGLAKLTETLTDMNNELLQLADDASVREELLKGASSTKYGAPVKKLGTRKTITKKGKK